jgi:LuxR family quorum sensing-dependent transcriptional regulator
MTRRNDRGAHSPVWKTMSETKSKPMNEILQAVTVADAIRHARSAPEIWRALKAYAEPLGFTHFSVLSPMEASEVKLKPHVIYADAPAAFIDAFDQRGLLRHHPLIQHALTTAEPFTTRQVQARGLTPEQKKALEFIGTELNLTAGFVVPVRRNGTLLGIVSYAGQTCRMGPIERSILHLLAHTGLVHALELKDAKDVPPIGLSPRELQCLQWASRGKTDAEIGVILGISARTARFHIENAKRKLGAATRVQAVAEAMRRNAIAA